MLLSLLFYGFIGGWPTVWYLKNQCKYASNARIALRRFKVGFLSK